MMTATLPVSGWLAPARAALDSYRRSADHLLNISLPFESFASGERSREFARLANRSARARAGVLREWSLAPLWWSGLASPSDLYAEVENAAAIDRDLAGAWDELLRAEAQEVANNVRETIAVATEPAQDLNAVAVDAVRTAAVATRSLDEPENLNAAAVEAVRMAANSAASARGMRELGGEMLDQLDARLNSGVLERTGGSETFEPATAVSPSMEASDAAAASRRASRKAKG